MNKQFLFLYIIVLSIVIGISSCASREKVNTDTTTVGDVKDVPEFFLNPPQSDTLIYGVGTAKLARLDLSRKLAVSRARDAIALQVQANIQTAITDYAQESGADNTSQLLSFSETTSRQIADISLQGTQVEQVSAGKDGTIYALVSFPKANVLKNAEQVFARNEDAAFAEFKAQEALKRLDLQLKNKPATVASSSE